MICFFLSCGSSTIYHLPSTIAIHPHHLQPSSPDPSSLQQPSTTTTGQLPSTIPPLLSTYHPPSTVYVYRLPSIIYHLPYHLPSAIHLPYHLPSSILLPLTSYLHHRPSTIYHLYLPSTICHLPSAATTFHLPPTSTVYHRHLPSHLLSSTTNIPQSRKS